MSSFESLIYHVPLFAPLPDKVKQRLEDIVITRDVSKGEILFRETDTAEAMYFINKGKVKLSKSSADGKEIVLDIRKTYDIFAEAALFSTSKTTYPATATIIESGTVSYMRNEDLETLLMEHPELGITLFRIMADRLRSAQSTLRDVALYGKLSALASTLIRLAEDYGNETEEGVLIDIKLTHEDLGNFFGATRESVTRMMNQLKKQGIISKNQGYFTIHKLDELREYMSN